MNIAFISYWSCPLTKLGILDSGGMSVYLLNLANQLSILGHKVDIFTRLHSRIDEDELVRQKSVNVIHLPQKEKDLYKDIYNFAEEVISYANINKIKYDIIHSHYYYSGLVAFQIQKKYSVPHIFTFHSLGKFEKNYDRINTEKRINAERSIVKNVDGIIASTELELKSILDDYQGDKSKIQIISPGVDHNIFKKIPKYDARKIIRIPASLKLILFVGRIDPNKGIDVLLKAVSILVDRYPNFAKKYRVILIGGDVKSKEFWKSKEVVNIRNLIQEKNLSCCVKFIGSKLHSELPIYYSAADLVILPSFHESFGLVVLEAMACQATVIASRVGGLTYLVQDHKNGRLFESKNYSQLATIIWELINNETECLRLAKNAFDYSQKFCWNIQAQKIVDIYKSFISPVEKFRNK